MEIEKLNWKPGVDDNFTCKTVWGEYEIKRYYEKYDVLFDGQYAVKVDGLVVPFDSVEDAKKWAEAHNFRRERW